MAWNDNIDINNPNNQPPELDEIINKLKDKFANFGNKQGGNNAQLPKKAVIKSILVVVFLVWMGSGFYIVDQGWQGVVFQFGKFQQITDAGPHWHLPYPMESHTLVYVDEIQSENIGFRNIRNQNRQFVGNVSSESLMLTKDENIIDAKFEIQYKIKNVTDYLFNVIDPKQTLRQVSQSAIRLVAGRHNMDYIITEGRSDVVAQIEQYTQQLLNLYKTGLIITAINMKDAQAPEQVQAAFSDVVKAREDKERLINEAETYANGILPQARGEAARMSEEAKAYQAQVIARATGDANRFSQIRLEYEKSPEVTKERLYLETMETVLSRTSKVVVDNQSNNIMYLPLDKLGMNRTIEAKASPNQQRTNQPTNHRVNGVRNAFRTREIR